MTVSVDCPFSRIYLRMRDAIYVQYIGRLLFAGIVTILYTAVDVSIIAC